MFIIGIQFFCIKYFLIILQYDENFLFISMYFYIFIFLLRRIMRTKALLSLDFKEIENIYN